MIENSPILKDGDSLSNYGINDNTQEKYAKLCIVYENSHGDLQNVWLNTFKGNILHFYDTSREDYRIGPNEELVKFITKHAGYRVLSATDFDKIKRITVKYNEEEYDLSDDTTKKFVKALKKLDKRQDEFHDSNLTAIAYTSDGDTYHIKVAAGERLSYTQDDIHVNGHAIECRINAEDPLNDFVPTPGKIVGYRSPGGIGVRMDSGVYNGYTIPSIYDSMIAKLIVHGNNREEAIARMTRALNEFIVLGVKTTIPFHKALMQNENFKKANLRNII